MKTTILFLLFTFTALHVMACMCNSSEYNFYKNLDPAKTVALVVMEDLTIGNNEIELGHFRLLTTIYDSETFFLADSFVVAGSNGSNCGERFSNYAIGDTLFLILDPKWGEDPLFLDDCGTKCLKVENSKCKGLNVGRVIQKINYSINQNKRCGCVGFEYAFDFYSHIDEPYSFCLASFIDFDYSVERDNRIFQTGHFIVLDTIGNSTLKVNAIIVALGENGVNCGEMFDQYHQGDTLILALDAPPFYPLSSDTFLLDGLYCGSHALRIKKGVDHDGLTYAQIKAKMHGNITNYELFQTKETCLVYPNPLSSGITIHCLNGTILKVKLFDINGKLVLQDEGLTVQEKEYHLEAISNGIYQLEIETTNGFDCQRIVKRD